MGISANIKRLRKEAGMTQEQLAEKIGVTRSTITQWEKGWSEPRMGKVEKLAAVFGVSKSEIIDTEAAERKQQGFTRVPLYGSIAAGTPIEMTAYENDYPIPTELLRRYGDGVFLLRVEGDSMSRTLPNGCLALIDPTDREPDGRSAYAVCVNGYDATVKRVRRLANGFELVPDSYDPTYRPTVYDYNEETAEQVTVIGRVVWFCVPLDFEV